MSDDIFMRVKRLLENHVEVLNKHSIGDEHANEAQDIIDELNVLIKNKAFIEHLEHEIEEEERKMVSDDLAKEILNGKFCVGGNCED
jgi:hypothetical protein